MVGRSPFTCRPVSAAPRRAAARLALALVLLWPAAARGAHGRQRAARAAERPPAAGRRATAGPQQRPAAKVTVGTFVAAIPDVELSNQDGRRVRLYTDLVRGKIVVLSFFYTDCEYVCSIQGHNFFRLQALLGGRLGREVSFVFITRAPRSDTPAKLKAWAKKNGVGRGWTLLTGDEREVERLVRTFTGDPLGRPEGHSAGVYIGNDATGAWEYSNGLFPPEKLLEIIGRVSGPRRKSRHRAARQGRPRRGEGL